MMCPSFFCIISLHLYCDFRHSTYGERDFPGGSGSKESACNAGDLGSILGSGRSPGEENGCPLHCSCLDSMDRGAWWAIVYRVAKSQTRLSD